MRREELRFKVDGLTCAAWLYLPEAEGPLPGVVMAHGFAGTRRVRLDAYAERFAAAGLAALVFDYRHFGGSEGEPRQLLDIRRQLADWRQAIVELRSQPRIDPARVALWGTSLSGGHVIRLGAADPAIAAVVSQVPFVDGLANARAARPADALRLFMAASRDLARRFAGRPPYYIKAVGPPGSVAAMTTPDAEQGYRSLIPPDGTWRDDVTARVLLEIASYRPGRAAARVRCPILLCLAQEDAVTPMWPALKVAARAPNAEVRTYPLKHFDIYVGEGFERAVADQIAFLSRHLKPAKG